MKKFILFISIALFTLVSIAQDGAAITFEKTTIDYGKIAKNSDGIRTFKFTNTGTAPLKITDVKATCGCTVPTYPKQDIMPGETGEIAIAYDTVKPGRFSKSIKVFTNTKEQKIVLRIKGNVLP